MGESRIAKATPSFLYKLAESLGTQGFAFVVSLVLARLLEPSDYSMLAVLTIFVSVSQVFVQSGLNTALIQKQEIDEADLSSAFLVNLALAMALYFALFILAPVIGPFFGMDGLSPAALRVLALVLLPGALISVQNAVVAREMNFRRLMLASLCATVFSGLVGIGMALAGMGYWALVGHQMSHQFGLVCALWIIVKWKPRAVFSLSRVSVLVRFGWKLLVAGLLDTGYINLHSAAIGKKFDRDILGFYGRGKYLPELVMNAVNGSIQSVMLPVLSEMQENIPRMKQVVRRSIITSSFLVLPLMAGLAAVAEPLVTLLLTAKWLPAVPFIQICCIDFAFYPIHTANLQAINAMGHSHVFLRLEIVKKSYGLLILAAMVSFFNNALAIAWGGVASTLLSAVVNAIPNRKLLGYGYLEQMRDMLPQAILAAIMFLAVFAMRLLPLQPAGLLLIQVFAGMVIYGGLAVAFRLESMSYSLDMLRRLFQKRTGRDRVSKRHY